jgi:hypothetical protein
LLGATGLIAVPILGLLYGALMMVIPLIYFELIIMVAYPFVVGFVLSWAAKTGKIRNMVVIGAAGVLFGVLAEYIGWVSWLAVLFKDVSFLIGFFFPGDILYLISVVAEKGAWSIGGSTPTGEMLYFLWFIEACIVIGGTAFTAIYMLYDIPFCEESNAWADRRAQIGAFLPLADAAGFKQSILQGSFSAFNALKPSPSGDNHFTALQVHACEKCKNFFVLNVKDVTLTVDGRGRTQMRQKNILSNLLISPLQLASLQRLGQVEPAAQTSS